MFLMALVVFGLHINSSCKSPLFSANVEALTSGEDGGAGYVICYYTTRVKVGHTMYDCPTCSKVYDEKGTGNYSKCWN